MRQINQGLAPIRNRVCLCFLFYCDWHVFTSSHVSSYTTHTHTRTHLLLTQQSRAMHISKLKGLRPIMRKSIKFLFCWVVLQCVCMSVYVCLVEQAFMDVGYIKHHHQPLISHSLYSMIDNSWERHALWNNRKCIPRQRFPHVITSVSACALMFSHVLLV